MRILLRLKCEWLFRSQKFQFRDFILMAVDVRTTRSSRSKKLIFRYKGTLLQIEFVLDLTCGLG